MKMCKKDCNCLCHREFRGMSFPETIDKSCIRCWGDDSKFGYFVSAILISIITLVIVFLVVYGKGVR